MVGILENVKKLVEQALLHIVVDIQDHTVPYGGIFAIRRKLSARGGSASGGEEYSAVLAPEIFLVLRFNAQPADNVCRIIIVVHAEFVFGDLAHISQYWRELGTVHIQPYCIRHDVKTLRAESFYLQDLVLVQTGAGEEHRIVLYTIG